LVDRPNGYNPSRRTDVNAEIIFSLQESPEGGYEARALGFPIFTPIRLRTLKSMVRDAISCHLEDLFLSVVNYSLNGLASGQS
jgi:hypothetical protein